MFLGFALASLVSCKEFRSDDTFIYSSKVSVKGTGKWEASGTSGVVCIHTALLPNSRLLCFERPHIGIYPVNPNTNGLLSTEIDLKGTVNSDGTWTASYTSIPITNNPFCAGHSQLGDGSILVVGGDNQSMTTGGVTSIVNGRKGVRTFTPCAADAAPGCTGTWTIMAEMSTERWYPTVLTLPDGSAMVIGGQTKNIDFENLRPTDNNPTYEYNPPKPGPWPKQLDILQWAYPHNLYAPSFVLPSGGVFVVVSNKSIIINPKTDSITNLPDLIVADHSPWIYPHSPTMFVLPMTIQNNFKFELQICGGSKLSTNDSSAMCMKINPDDSNPSWTQVDDMPHARLMPDAVILPDGTILMVNGASKGQAGGNQGQVQYAKGPVFAADLYDPTAPLGSRWTTLASASNKRLYHSGALLLESGHVVTTGSEMNNYADYWPTQSPNCFPLVDTVCTDPFNYNIERFSPPYLQQGNGPVLMKAPLTATHGSVLQLDLASADSVARVTFIRTGTSTHSTNTDQRFIELIIKAKNATSVFVTLPSNVAQAPIGNWFIWALDGNGVPSAAKTIQLQLGAPSSVIIPANAVAIAHNSAGLVARSSLGLLISFAFFLVN